jgi:nitrogenase-associated protein
MVEVVFYQKPGCRTNAKQIATLREAGHAVVVRDLLREPWTGERLLSFFGEAPVSGWFNPASPKLKSGVVDPSALDADAAMALLLADPILIRRPLIEAQGRRGVGFEGEPAATLLGPVARDVPQGCSRVEEMS